jgi:hypothetical protein
MPSTTTFRVIPWLVFPVFLTRYDGNHRAETSPESSRYGSDENYVDESPTLHFVCVSILFFTNFLSVCQSQCLLTYHSVATSVSGMEQNIRSAGRRSNTISSISGSSTVLTLTPEMQREFAKRLSQNLSLAERNRLQIEHEIDANQQAIQRENLLQRQQAMRRHGEPAHPSSTAVSSTVSTLSLEMQREFADRLSQSLHSVKENRLRMQREIDANQQASARLGKRRRVEVPAERAPVQLDSSPALT